MTVRNNDKWAKCLEIIKDNLSDAHYESWFAPIQVENYDGDHNVLTLRVPTSYYAEQLEGRFYNLLEKTLIRVYGEGIRLKYSYNVIKDDPQSHVVAEEPHRSMAVSPNNPFTRQEYADLDPQLNPIYTFENYCESKSNKLAFAIANAIADNPKCQTFNPMFIFGATGVGKTHLIQAIGIRMKERNPRARVLYLSARTFESQYTTAVRRNTVNDFINFYQSIDMLIMDDVQEFAGKTARGVGKLLEHHMVDHIIASHLGVNPKLNEQFAEGTLKYTLVPQGTLAEKIRAAAYGLGGVLTPTGVGTPMETELDELGRKKEVVVIDGKKYLLEMPLHADYAFIRPSVADKFGNYYCKKATKNFNYVMAGAADKTIIAPEKIVEIGEIDPDMFAVAGVLVDAIAEGEKPWQI